ncbi:MAG TPA: peptidoglycan editing factor PgeF, partial [Draconibacterium sp.]|nr:peptidoglycan editing factor PgeF [Draconibacterium sp.]
MDKKNGLVQYSVFELHKNLLAFSTTKQTFEKVAPRFTGDTPEIFQENREQLAKFLKIQTSQLVFPRQTHTNCVVSLSEIPEKEIKETDALVTNQPGICLCVQTADCVPILLFDPKENVIAAVHAGWRGTVQKISIEAVEKMKANFGSSPENLLALIGPSIGPGVYEVGDEVVKEARKNIPNAEKTLHKNTAGNFHFNLWEANRQLLLQCGLAPKNTKVSEECSYTQNEKYYSARRDGVRTGRMVSG